MTRMKDTIKRPRDFLFSIYCEKVLIRTDWKRNYRYNCNIITLKALVLDSIEFRDLNMTLMRTIR